MATNKIKLCSEALMLIGTGPISSFDGVDAKQVAANTLYEPTVEDILSLHRWRFATKAEQASRIADAPATSWEAAYQVPSGAQVIHSLEVNGYPIKFDRFENELHCNAVETDVVICTYSYRADESRWPTWFDSVVRMKLAAQFALTIAASAEIANIFEGKFIRQLTAAKLMDSQSQTARKFPVGGLARYHAGRA